MQKTRLRFTGITKACPSKIFLVEVVLRKRPFSNADARTLVL